MVRVHVVPIIKGCCVVNKGMDAANDDDDDDVPPFNRGKVDGTGINNDEEDETSGGSSSSSSSSSCSKFMSSESCGKGTLVANDVDGVATPVDD